MASDIGSNVTLGCLVRGHPDPQVTWKREDGLLLFNRPHTHSSVTQSKSGLHITRKLNLFGKSLCWKENWLWFMATVFFLILFQTYGWKTRESTSVRLRTTLARLRPRPESLWLDWVGANAPPASLVLFIPFNLGLPAHNHCNSASTGKLQLLHLCWNVFYTLKKSKCIMISFYKSSVQSQPKY